MVGTGERSSEIKQNDRPPLSFHSDPKRVEINVQNVAKHLPPRDEATLMPGDPLRGSFRDVHVDGVCEDPVVTIHDAQRTCAGAIVHLAVTIVEEARLLRDATQKRVIEIVSRVEVRVGVHQSRQRRLEERDGGGSERFEGTKGDAVRTWSRVAESLKELVPLAGIKALVDLRKLFKPTKPILTEVLISVASSERLLPVLREGGSDVLSLASEGSGIRIADVADR